jgi:ribosomal protein S18 acetylase RimI-like enzyme
MCSRLSSNNQKYVIRRAQLNDLPQVLQLDYEAFSPHGTAELPTIIEARLEVFSAGFIVLEKDEMILGYGSSEKWLDDRIPAMDEDPATTHSPFGQIFCITAMAVEKDHRKQGLGSAILEHLKSVARMEKCKYIILETVYAQDFYLKQGFHVIGEREQMNVNLTILGFDL